MKISKALLIATSLMLAIFLLIFLVAYAGANKTVKTWNKGICNECGGSYEFKCMAGRYNDRFVFQCANCHKIITLNYNPYPKK